jgi:hypothetical protein
MSDWGGFKKIMDEARANAEEEKRKPPEACPLDGTPLEYHAGKALWVCPMGNYRASGPAPN